MPTIGFLGAGKMGEALMVSIIKGGLAQPGGVVACDALSARRDEVRRRYRVRVTAEATDLVDACDIIFLAVKPQDLDTLLQRMQPTLRRRHLLISIAAGKTLEHLASCAGPKARLVRVMPNLPVSVGAGMLVYCLGANTTQRDRRTVARLLAVCGEVLELEERHFDVVTALSGSGPAFFAFYMRSMAEAAVRLDLPPEAAHRLAMRTMLGTARYLEIAGMEPSEFIQAVASPKGTTAAGLEVLEKSSLPGIVERTITAATKRGRALRTS